ncbi:hypothetical protein THAOC_31582, partial [Thalassiosira oceanica]
MMNNNGPASNFVLNTIESLAGLMTRSPDLENLRQILEQLTGEQWQRVSRDSDSDSRERSRNSLNTSDTTQRHGLNERHQLQGIDQVYISFPQYTPSSHIDSLQADGRSENRNARNRDARQTPRGLLQNLGHRITDYFSPSGRQDSETNVSENSEQNAVDDGSTSSRSPPSDGDGSPEESGEYLHDEPHHCRFPDGDVCFTVADLSHQLSWSSVRYSHKNNKRGNKVTYHSCIGRYECPVDGCDFAANSAQPKHMTGRPLCKGMCPDKALSQSTCIHHKAPLVHTGPCPAYWTREIHQPTEDNEHGMTTITHHKIITIGSHRMSIFQKGLQKSSKILSVPTKGQLHLFSSKVEGEEPVQSLHPALINTGHSSSERASNDRGGPRLRHFPRSTNPGKSVAKEESRYAHQTDSIEKWFKDDGTGNTYTQTITSRHSEVLGRHVATVMSISFGRKAAHYKRHFKAFILSLGYDTFEEFENGFDGNISDFSDAEFLGFRQAFMSVYGITDAESVDWERLYKFCLVHFQRSVERVKTNYSVVPHGRQEEFQEMVDVLCLKRQPRNNFLTQMLQEFPLTTNWIEWYLEHFRGALVFPAMRNGTIKGHGVDTNAGEVTGRWFKTRAYVRSEIRRPTLEEGLGIMFREGQTVQDDYSAELNGVRTGYGTRSSPRERAAKKTKRSATSVVRNIKSLLEKSFARLRDKEETGKRKQCREPYFNDGRSPDKGSQLVPKQKSRRLSKNRSPRANKTNVRGAQWAPRMVDVVNLAKAIPFQFQSGGVQYNNTCPLDSVLMCLYLNRKLGIVSVGLLETLVLHQTLNMIEAEQYTDARLFWLEHSKSELERYEVDSCSVQACPNDDLFSSNAIVNHVYNLTVCYDPESGTIQSALDDLFNTHSESMRSGCDVIGNSNEDSAVRFNKCKGHRRVRKKIVERPIILEIVTSRDHSSKATNDEREVTSGDQMELYITIQGERYKLVGALLNNEHHYRSITPLQGSFLRYDGILQNSKHVNYMKWLRPDECFGKGYRRKPYKAVVYWYVSCSHLSQETQLGGKTSRRKSKVSFDVKQFTEGEGEGKDLKEAIIRSQMCKGRAESPPTSYGGTVDLCNSIDSPGDGEDDDESSLKFSDKDDDESEDDDDYMIGRRAASDSQRIVERDEPDDDEEEEDAEVEEAGNNEDGEAGDIEPESNGVIDDCHPEVQRIQTFYSSAQEIPPQDIAGPPIFTLASHWGNEDDENAVLGLHESMAGILSNGSRGDDFFFLEEFPAVDFIVPDQTARGEVETFIRNSSFEGEPPRIFVHGNKLQSDR